MIHVDFVGACDSFNASQYADLESGTDEREDGGGGSGCDSRIACLGGPWSFEASLGRSMPFGAKVLACPFRVCFSLLWKGVVVHSFHDGQLMTNSFLFGIPGGVALDADVMGESGDLFSFCSGSHCLLDVLFAWIFPGLFGFLLWPCGCLG